MVFTFVSCALFALVGASNADSLKIVHDESDGTLSVFRSTSEKQILIQNAKTDHRPYIHPIAAPEGRGVLTALSPEHHEHQTGLFWGFTQLNSRDYFHHADGDYWRRQSLNVIQAEGEAVQWQTVYDLLDADGSPILTETQGWTLRDLGDSYVLDLEWTGEAKTDVIVGESDFGGLFLRMPWREGIEAEVMNAARQRNAAADGKRAMWLDVGMQVEGREDLAHIAIFDHPQNPGFPTPWRVDGQLGVGPARARLGEWSLKNGEQSIAKHQFRVYGGDLNDVELTQAWKEFTGQRGTYALWGLAQREGREAQFLTPEKAIEEMTLQDGFEVNVYASEPMITQPMAFCWDDRGRMWIAENRDYETRGRGFSKFGDSRILILEDTDHDGVADSRKVFLEGIPFPAGIAVGFDGLWLGAPPNLLFVPDRDHNDEADVDDIEVRLTGWGIRDRHETLNSFHWGPDGWLYGCQGYATPSKVRKPVGKGRLYKHNEAFPEDLLESDGVDINGGVWRYHPTKDRFEVVAHGFSNPWGIDYDAKGQLFISACVIPHMWHVIPGGIYHRQGGRHFNPYVYGDIRTIADHRHRSAHGGARVYLSDAFPSEYQGQLFMANIHEHAVLTDVLESKGSGFIAHHGEDFLLANNAQWIGFSMEIGPEGAVYVLDWHDADICGKEVVHKDTGRVFRITPSKSNAKDWRGRYADLAEMNDRRLVSLQTSESAWHARRARVILQSRASKGELQRSTHNRLREIYDSNSNADYRLRAMWALHVTGGLDETALIQALDHKDEHLRAWAVQLLCEDEQPSAAALEKFVIMARQDSSAVVRLYLASVLQRMNHNARWPIAEALATHGEDAEDHNIPKMIWFGIEPLVPSNPQRALNLAVKSRIPLVQQFVARRATDANAFQVVVGALNNPGGTDAQHGLLTGMRDGLNGRLDIKAPSNWSSVYAKLQQSENGKVQRLAVELAQLFGDTSAANKMLATLVDESADDESRLQALRGLARQKRDELRPLLLELVKNVNLRLDAIRAMAEYNDNRISSELLSRYSDFDTDEKLAVLQTMAARSNSGWTLTQAIKRGEIPRREVPAYIARQLRRVVGNGFVEVWGSIDQFSADKKAAFAKYQALLTDASVESANPHEGREIFQMACAACHKLYGEGADVGPDITGSNRANLDYILGNILDPSGEIQDDYRMVMITTRDGRTFGGNIAVEDDRQLTLRIVGQDVVISKSEIQSREIAPVSMMPEGLLSELDDRDVLNLISYLRTTEQVSKPEN